MVVIEVFGLFGLVAFVVASLVVGFRVLLLASKTRQLPETTVSLSLILAGGIGTALMVLPLLVDGLSAGATYVVLQVALIANHLGFALLYLFVWRVFRPSEAWAACLFVACLAALLVGAGGMAMELVPGEGFSGRTTPGSVWFWSSLNSRFVAYGWAAVESFRYYGLLKRRLALGLAEEEIVDRFFYWGVCTSAVFLIWVNIAVVALVQGSSWVLATSNLVSALLGFVVAGSLFLAFFPMRRSTAESSADASPS